jgi:hypothetical protein
MLDEIAIAPVPTPAETLPAAPAPSPRYLVAGNDQRVAEARRQLGPDADIVKLEGEALGIVERVLPDVIDEMPVDPALALVDPNAYDAACAAVAAAPTAALAAPAPATPEPEKTVDFGKGMKVPYSMVRSFASPTCRNHCQQGLLVQPGKTTATFCFCALKGCRDAIVGARSARAAARPLPGVSTQVNARSLESLEKLTARVARLDEQIAQRDAEAAGEIATLLASADTGEGKAAEYTRGIRQAEEGLEASAERRRDLERQIRESEEADADVTAKLTAARASEAEIVGKVAAIRRQARVLEGKRDQRTAGMRREREKLQRRVNLRLAHQPAVAVPEVSPAPAPATAEEAPRTVIHQQVDPAAAGADLIAINGNGEPVVESSSVRSAVDHVLVEHDHATDWPAGNPLALTRSTHPAPTAESAAFFRKIEEENDAALATLRRRPLEVTPVVEVLVPAEAAPPRELPLIGEEVEIRALDSRGQPESDWCKGTVVAQVSPDGVDVQLPGELHVSRWHNGHGPMEWRRPVAPAGEPAA